MEWLDSPSGKKWFGKYQQRGLPTANRRSEIIAQKGINCKCNDCVNNLQNHITQHSYTPSILKCNILSTQIPNEFNVLIDTGALQGNYITEAAAKRLEELKILPSLTNAIVCSPINDTCTEIKKIVCN